MGYSSAKPGKRADAGLCVSGVSGIGNHPSNRIRMGVQWGSQPGRATPGRCSPHSDPSGNASWMHSDGMARKGWAAEMFPIRSNRVKAGIYGRNDGTKS